MARGRFGRRLLRWPGRKGLIEPPGSCMSRGTTWSALVRHTSIFGRLIKPLCGFATVEVKICIRLYQERGMPSLVNAIILRRGVPLSRETPDADRCRRSGRRRRRRAIRSGIREKHAGAFGPVAQLSCQNPELRKRNARYGFGAVAGSYASMPALSSIPSSSRLTHSSAIFPFSKRNTTIASQVTALPPMSRVPIRNR